MSTESSKPVMQLSEELKDAMKLPSGARFYRCALQVNPFAYLTTQKKKTTFSSEEAYNDAIIEACLENKIEVIAVPDHHRVKDSLSLVHAAREANLYAFLGCEAVSKDGVHFLCLFDPDKDDNLERFIGECGVRDSEQASPPGEKYAIELLECAKTWGAVCIATHITLRGGLLAKLSGQSRINVWTHPSLLACTIPGSVEEVEKAFKLILQNKDKQHMRERPLAILNVADVKDPADLISESASCFIKMSDVSVEAFRQAFLDPESRIRLHSDTNPEPHAEFLSMSWEGGFLRDTAVHFNENLNVLIGGRGTGKSTLIESIRYVLGLDPIGEEAEKAHDGVVRFVLQPGTKVSLLVRSHTPAETCYRIERTVPNPPIVRSESGEVLDLTPSQVMPDVELFGQHEIAELTKSKVKLTSLLKRFEERNPSLADRKTNVQLALERSRRRIVEINTEMTRLDERLSALPGLEETQKRFQQAGLEERFKEKSLLIREERVFSELQERLEEYRNLNVELSEGLPIDTTFVSAKALEGLPNADILAKAEPILQRLSEKLKSLSDEFEKALSETTSALTELRASWSKRKSVVEKTYEELLRELQKTKVDGEEFIQLQRQIETLRPLNDKMTIHRTDLGKFEIERRNLLAEWEEVKAKEYRELEKAAIFVTQILRDTVRVKVTMAGERKPLEQLLREVGGNLATALNRLNEAEQISLPELAKACREGVDTLKTDYRLPTGAAERIAQAGPELFMRIEELDLPSTAEIELNTAPDGEAANWQTLESLSTGQKATAVLLLLLLESNAPLVVDQPEDDLDNRFITDGVVPMMRQEKRRRQFVFSTHNANIPVLGDAELILGLSATGVANEGQARIDRNHMASIDSKPIRELVEDILEGGKAAFEMRRSKYGF